VLVVASRASGDVALQQAAEANNLARAIKIYTIILAVFGVIQIRLLMLRKGGA
jgi:hypothetical protein